jgi:hypothetical protein
MGDDEHETVEPGCGRAEFGFRHACMVAANRPPTAAGLAKTALAAEPTFVPYRPAPPSYSTDAAPTAAPAFCSA